MHAAKMSVMVLQTRSVQDGSYLFHIGTYKVAKITVGLSIWRDLDSAAIVLTDQWNRLSCTGDGFR